MKISSFFRSADGKLGTFQGVYVPNVLQMIGAIFFLRLGWILGHVGITQMSLIIAFSSLILFLTTLSMAVIISNMRMRGGGAYYLISRSLGVEFGSAIGVLQFISQLCSIALCVTAFTLSLAELFPTIPLWMFKSGTLTLLVLISYISTQFAIKTQLLIFTTLLVSIGTIFCFFSGVPEGMPLITEHTSSLTFWAAFAMFYPATTGIETGMSLSGDLKDPTKSLTRGTILAVITVFGLYLTLSLFLSQNVASDYLKAHPFILYYTNRFSFLILAGIWAATLSSALGAILGAPRIVQAIAKDRVLPSFLAKGHGPNNEPRVATLGVFLLGLALTLFTEINQIIPMLTMSCLICYGLINFIAFFESFLQNPSWRPTLQIPWGIPLLTSLVCFAAMFMINPGACFIVICLVVLLCIWTSSRKVSGNWDDIRYSLISYFVNKGTAHLGSLEKDAKNWRPQILAFFEPGTPYKNLAFFAHALNQEKGLLTFGTLFQGDHFKQFKKDLKENLTGLKIPAHLHINRELNAAVSAEKMIENYGFGQLKPNTMLLQLPTGDVDGFIRLLLRAHTQEKNVILLKEDPNKDFLFADPSRQNKQIDLWWRGKYPGNFELCFAMAFLLQQSKFWPRAKLCIKMLSGKEELEKEELIQQFERYRSRLRIKNLEFSPLVDSEGDFFSYLSKASQEVELTFLGLKRPEPETSVEEYKDYYLKLLENTQDTGNIAYVLSGEKVKFRKIFL